jgi:hypothetical protein
MRQKKLNWWKLSGVTMFGAWAMFFFSLIIPDKLGPIQYAVAALLAFLAVVGFLVITGTNDVDLGGRPNDHHIS